MASGDSFNENAIDELVGHRLALLRYEAGTTEALLKAYDAALRDVNRAMVDLQQRVRAGQSKDQLQLTRLVALGTDLTKRVRELERILRLTLDGRLHEAAEAEAAFQETLFRDVGASFHAVPESTVATAVRTSIGGGVWTERLAVDLVEAHDRIQAALARTLAKGASMDTIAKAIGETTGIVETYRGRLIAIARTETQRVANTVALATYAENLDVLRGVQWLATLDSRTCLVCAPLHNKVWHYDVTGRLSKGFRPPPLHPRCRCFASPVSKSWRDIGVNVRRPDLFTEKPALDTTFDAWLKRQGKETQLEFFGDEVRREAWRSGKVPLSKFSDAGRILNLGELRARYPGVAA